MRMAHIYPPPVPVKFPSHHEIHLREDEAYTLTQELLEAGFSQWEGNDDMRARYPMIYKVVELLGSRNSYGSDVPYTYPKGIKS